MFLGVFVVVSVCVSFGVSVCVSAFGEGTDFFLLVNLRDLLGRNK